MKPFHELDHYQILEVSREASSDEIERGYALAREAYAPGALASYSVLDEREAATMRQQIESAYSILTDPERRAAYDATLGGNDPAARDELIVLEPYENEREVPRDAQEAPPAATSVDEFSDLDDGDPDAPWDGARLRRARLARAVELDAITAVTKVNPVYLAALEEDDFEALPAAVYVRGFVDAYARVLDLDARAVASSYVERFKVFLEGNPRPGHPRQTALEKRG